MPPSKSDILPYEGGITPMWALACGKYGIQGAFGALDDVFGAPPKLTEGHVPSVPPPPLGAPLTASSIYPRYGRQLMGLRGSKMGGGPRVARREGQAE